MNRIYEGDCIEGLKTLPENTIDCCITSPPYFGLRDYGNDGQIGLEETPELYVSKMVEVFTQVKRVLKNEGTLWLNLGDSYAHSMRQSGVEHAGKLSQNNKGQIKDSFKPLQKGYKEKDLIGIPWMVAFALRSSGWYLRQDIIWAKPNPMPESVTDRCTKSHEYIFLMSKSSKYYYDADAIKTPIADASVQRLQQDVENQNGSNRVPGKTNGSMKAVGKVKGNIDAAFLGNAPTNYYRCGESGDGMANKKSVWTVTTRPFSEAHFATFPERLITDCVKAGCPENGIILDPFMGAGTTALVAKKLNRNYVGFELNPAYIEIAEKRLYNEIGIFL